MQGVVIRLRVRDALRNGCEFRIASAQLGTIDLDSIDYCFRGEIRIRDAKQVQAARSGVTYHEIPIARKGTLHVNVELHNVGRLEIVIDGLQLGRDVGIRIEICDNIRKRRIQDGGPGSEGRVEAAREEIILRQDFVIEDAEACADGGLAISKGVPRDADARGEVLQGRIGMPGVADDQRGIGYMAEVADFSVDLGGHGGELVPKAEVDS